jgi:hypothetical protein
MQIKKYSVYDSHMRKIATILICISVALTGCGAPTGNDRPEEKKLVDSIKLLLTYMNHSHPKLINWDSNAVDSQLKEKLPVGYATEAGWTLKWNNAKTGELPQAVVPWELLGQFPSKYAQDVNNYHAGTYAPQSVISQIGKLELNDDPYFAGIVNVKMSAKDSHWVVFTSVPFLPVTDPAYGFAHSENGNWKIVDFGTATVGCGNVPANIQTEFGFTCP